MSHSDGRTASPAAGGTGVSGDAQRSEAHKPATDKLLDGEQEAKVIALRLGSPPQGDANWTLRLLARRVVELEIVDSISYETVRRTLKKTG